MYRVNNVSLPRKDEFASGSTYVADSVELHVHVIAPPLVGWGLEHLVQRAGPPIVSAGVSFSVQEALRSPECAAADVLLLDMDDGYCLADLNAIRYVLRGKLLVLTSASGPEFSESVFEGGAHGVLHKRSDPSTLFAAIAAVGRGGRFVACSPPDLDARYTPLAPSGPAAVGESRSARASPLATLTPRERQIVAAIAKDASASLKVVAGRLGISEHTLRNHLTSVYSKLGVAGRLGLYAFANRNALQLLPSFDPK